VCASVCLCVIHIFVGAFGRRPSKHWFLCVCVINRKSDRVCACACLCLRVCVCVCERERERERTRVCLFVNECVSVYVYDHEFLVIYFLPAAPAPVCVWCFLALGFVRKRVA